MKKYLSITLCLQLFVLAGFVTGEDKSDKKTLELVHSNDFITTDVDDTLVIELTMQAGTTIDSALSLGSCVLASDYAVIVNSPDFIKYYTNDVTVNNYGGVRAYFTISVDLSAPFGTYVVEVIYVIFRYSDECRSRMLRYTVLIIPPQVPVADFTASPVSIVEGGTVHFTDQSKNVITNWLWDFGDGNNSIDMNPTHTYSTAGNYDVSLIVSGPAGSDTLIKEDYMQVLPQGTPGGQLWDFVIEKGAISSPTIDQSGTIYIGGYAGSSDDFAYLYAINTDGTEKWKYTAGHFVSSCVIGSNGNIYIASHYWLEAIDTNGNQLWTYPIGGDIWDIAVGVDGTIFIITSKSGYNLQALSPDGELIWNIDMLWNSGIPMRVSISPDGTIYAIFAIENSTGHRLYSINPSGSIKWIKEITGAWNLKSKIAIDSEGALYVGGYKKLFAINPDGTVKWTYTGTALHDDFSYEPTIGLNGDIYVVDNPWYTSKIISLNNNGNINWTYELPTEIISSVTVGADEMLYFTAKDSNLYALNPNGSFAWKFKCNINISIKNTFYPSPTISDDRILYFAIADKLFAVSTTSEGLADSPWPKAGQNLMNTGRQINPAPYVISPKKDSVQVDVNTTLEWSPVAGAIDYELELSTVEDFTGGFVRQFKVSETTLNLENLESGTDYYWQARTNSIEGLSAWSTTWNFKTIVDLPSQLLPITPVDDDSITGEECAFAWYLLATADEYQIQIASDDQFANTVIDSTVSDTTITISTLEIGVEYFWRACGINLSGKGEWSEIKSFILKYPTSINENTNQIPEYFSLEQNYPNPFNPVTTIKYDIPKPVYVELGIYNIRGQLIEKLLSDYSQPGRYYIKWDASKYPSGVYFYKIHAKDFVDINKMVLMK